MQPYTVHVVMIVEPSFVCGGHFYFGVYMNCTLHGWWLCECHESGPTNATHPFIMAWVQCHQMVLYAYGCYHKVSQGKEPESHELPFTPDNLEDLLVLTGTWPGTRMVFGKPKVDDVMTTHGHTIYFPCFS